MATEKMVFKKIRAVTLGVLKFQKGQPRYLCILSAMFLGKPVPGSKKGVPTMVHAVDLETGETGVVLCPTIMQKELVGNYPRAAYVGKGFEILVSRDPEKNYNYVAIAEVALPDEFVAPDLGGVDPSALVADDVLMAGKPREEDEGDEEEGEEEVAPTPARKTPAKSKRR